MTEPKTAEEIQAKIAEIDLMFDCATGWGSWMADASGWRRSLIERLEREHGISAPHKHEHRTA
jgi:hypothetical protein